MSDFVFKEIDKSTVIESNLVNYTQNLTATSLGVQSKKIVSGSISSSYWDSLNVLFYTSVEYLMDEHHHNCPKGVILCLKKKVSSEGGILYWTGINKL